MIAGLSMYRDNEINWALNFYFKRIIASQTQ